MIEVRKLNGEEALINSDIIRRVESLPDTIITFIDGQTLTVKDTPSEIKNKIITYKKNFMKKDD